MKDRLLPAAIIPAILDLAIRNRLNVETLLHSAEVDPGVLSHSGTFVSVEQQLKLFDAAYQGMNNPAFGLLLGESIQYHSLDLVGQLIATSRNVQEALDELFLFKDLVTPLTSFSLETLGFNAVLVYSVDRVLVKSNWIAHHDVMAASIFSIANAIIPQGLRLTKVRFVHTQPDYVDEYQRIFNTSVEFGCLRNELVFDKRQLSEPLLTSYPEYHSGVRARAKDKLKSIESRETLAAKVAYFISRNLGAAATQLEDVAANFNMTPRTLQRKLKLENTSFVTIRDQCRHQRALRDLSDPGVDMEELAELLGFSDISNFYHAFKRWQGESPGAYRKQALANRGL
ncbi:AraC family transcriptional regulator [Ketobacter sp. MCCC 1A13808]|uniref:AraC family transcriptional regulator n=1 Tax=Ketobacter sp. MCCC 1A13808 TaxID=2602738 RepID=UPI000F12AB5A|nr:AraC family transcriptional regulator [Ketobacter sp. MCCC 1A13808]MVF10779.1 AraC family transcriptional regulator [Ketobacter sp. MCCC 1A13808]RLP56192.1 MAG: AraC family transcriptional regulator [Ketobacter sp.]